MTTLNAVPGNLPMQATGFVGREVEISDLLVEIRAHCLVTLTGVGGVGKTRLALQVAAELVPDFEDGVWLVELAPVGDPAAVPDAVATALGITAQPGKSVTASVAQACRAVVSRSFWTTASTSLTRLAISSKRSCPFVDGEGDRHITRRTARRGRACGRSRRSTSAAEPHQSLSSGSPNELERSDPASM